MSLRRHLAAWAALACALAGAPAGAGLTVSGRDILCDGKPLFLRGAYYVQPAASHQYFLIELDEEQLARDFRAARQAGLNCVAISVNWGEFMPSLDVAERRVEWDAAVAQRLRRLLDCARRENLIVNLWFCTARMPAGVPGAKWNEPQTDRCGHEHAGFYGYVWDNYPGCVQFDEFEWQAFLDFHRRVAALTRGYDNVILDPLDWQHLNMNYWSWANARNLAAWRAWLQAAKAELSHWNTRWGEANASWQDVVFPMDDWVRKTAARHAGSPYAGKPNTPEGPKTQDFRAWHDGLCNDVAKAITGALKQVRPDLLIGQRVDLWHYGDWRANTWAVGKVDFLFHGWYSNTPEEARDARPHIEGAVRHVTERWPRPMPLVFWETGMTVPADLARAEAERLQALQLAATETTTRALGLSGWMWWTWRDYCLSDTALHYGLTRLDATPKPALTGLPSDAGE